MNNLLSIKTKNGNVIKGGWNPLKYTIKYCKDFNKFDKLFEIIELENYKYRCIVDCVGMYDYWEKYKK